MKRPNELPPHLQDRLTDGFSEGRYPPNAPRRNRAPRPSSHGGYSEWLWPLLLGLWVACWVCAAAVWLLLRSQ